MPHIVFFGEKYRFTRQTILLLETMKNYLFGHSMLKALWTDSIFLLDKFRWQGESNILVYYHAKYSCQWKNWWDNKVMDTNDLCLNLLVSGVGKRWLHFSLVFSFLNIKLSLSIKSSTFSETKYDFIKVRFYQSFSQFHFLLTEDRGMLHSQHIPTLTLLDETNE